MGVARLLLEEVVDVVGADVGAPRLLPFPRALRRLPHRRRCWLLSFTRTRCGERKPPVEEGGVEVWGDEGVSVGARVSAVSVVSLAGGPQCWGPFVL